MLPLRILGFLWLMFSPCGSESRSCPPDLGPPILRPPEVIKEYGHSLVVNCSSNTEEEYEGLYWRVGNRAFEEDWGSVELDLSLLNYDMNVQCRMKLNESYECSTDLEITVYKNPEVVSSVKHVSDTGEETQYELQCDVFNVAPVQNLTVRVYKNNEAVLIKAFNDSTKTPVNETATLPISVKRTEHVVQLRCEAQLDFGARGEQPPVVVSQTHSVSALHAPEMKRENRTEVKFVLKGDKVTLDCEAEGNPPPVFSWTCDGVDLLGKTNRVTFYPNVTTICICRAANRLGNITKKYVIEINAEASSANPPIITTPAAQRPRGCPLILVPPKIVARFGDPVSAVCNTSATDAEGIGWEVPVQGIGPVPPPSVSWNVEKLVEWEIEPVCYLNLKDGTQCSVTLPVTLYHTPDKVSISGPDHDLIEGNEYRLKCYIHNVAPAEKLKVFWYKDDDELPVREFYEESRTPVTVSDTLIITPTRHYNGSVFKCLAVLDLRPDGPQNLFTVSSPYTAVVQYQPLFVSCPSHFIAVEHESSLDMFPCQMDGNPAPTVQWYHEGEVFNSSEKLTRNDAGQYILEIKNIHGSTNTSVNITVEYGPSFTCSERYEVKVNTHIKSLCEPEGEPSPTLTWFKDGKEKVQWTKHDSGEYEIEANNKHGTAKHKVYLDILYAPEFKDGNLSLEVTQGENVTLDCAVEGNPPPEVVWSFSPDVTPGQTAGWRQRTITVTAATSGVYSCNATNEVGNVSRTVSLVFKSKSRGLPFPIWVILVILATLLFIFLLVFFLKRQKSHGQYSFIAANADNISLSTRSTEGRI
ncbi:hemicentin-2 isoform X3 [Salarias fasciatus]|uniref:hemicentin-2 isoform X3 n=1 Tax=Salarias fasciatus TaxID=181472 RepID=UPI00117668E3|nr:intercellular adhesion molecule 5 isoform X3 [Salarias fasciatus]